MIRMTFTHLTRSTLSAAQLNELLAVRKRVFADRLNWEVSVHGDLECDEYDHPATGYLLGYCLGRLVAGLRLLETTGPYMLEGPFRSFFQRPAPKAWGLLESSRFFVDKTALAELGLSRLPLTSMLLAALHRHVQGLGREAVVTVVSRAMTRIVWRAGWHYQVLEIGLAGPGEPVWLLDMPVTPANLEQLEQTIEQGCAGLAIDIRWPTPAMQMTQLMTA